VRPAADPLSTVNSANLLSTCRNCHANAGAQLVSWDPHPQPKNKERSILVYYTNIFMEFLLAGVFLFFGLHTVLWAYRSFRNIAQRRKGGGGQFLLSSGRGARFAAAEPLAAEDYLACAHLDGQREARIFLAARIDYQQLLDYHGALLSERARVDWDARTQAVQARRRQCLGELVLRDEPWPEADPLQIQAVLLQAIRACGPACLPWSEAARQLQARLAFLRRLAPQDWPDAGDAALMATLEDWLAPYLHNLSRLAQMAKLDLQGMLLARLGWEQRQQLDALAPGYLQVPSGSRIRLDYSAEVPVLAVRLQEMFGLADTPRVAGGQVPVLLHLLSPARRPVQITGDLSAFWQGSYHEVKKELKGRYPKHHWPEHPATALPVAGGLTRHLRDRNAPPH